MRPGNHRIGFRLFVFCLFFVGLCLLSFPTEKAQAQSSDAIHIVQPGETLGTIATKYGISYQQLARYNGISNPNLVRVGQRLRIPSANAKPAPAPAPDGGAPAPTPDSTPAAPKICRGELSYSVRSGDSLHRIAASFDVSVAALIARNSLPSSMIIVGQRLLIPANC
jgi:LysM repeat protein